VKGYSTLQAPNDRKKTYYYAPREKEWGESLVANLGSKNAQGFGMVEVVRNGKGGGRVA